MLNSALCLTQWIITFVENFHLFCYRVLLIHKTIFKVTMASLYLQQQNTVVFMEDQVIIFIPGKVAVQILPYPLHRMKNNIIIWQFFQLVIDKLFGCRSINFFSYARIHIGHYPIASFSFPGSIANSSKGCHPFLAQIAASFSLIVSEKTMTFLSAHDMTISPSSRSCFTVVDK